MILGLSTSTFVFMGCGGIKGVQCLVELFLLLVWVCLKHNSFIISPPNRPVKLHPKPALDMVPASHVDFLTKTEAQILFFRETLCIYQSDSMC